MKTMTKKQRADRDEERRLTRKEVLRKRRHARQTRQIRLAVSVVVGLLIFVILLAIIVEYLIRPRQAVAEVNGTQITLDEWQDRVRLTRARMIVSLEDQLEAFQDVGLVQQFSGQQISYLQQPDLLGELVLEQMIDEELIRQAAEKRGIEVTDEEVDERLAEQFNYFGGESPTPLPTPTETIQPTPSLTPIPTKVITEVLPTNTPFPTPTTGPTVTPRPTATPVSEEAFREELNLLLERYRGMGVAETTFREAIRGQLYREKLVEALAEAEELPSEEEMVSVFVLSFDSKEAADDALQRIADEDFLTVWNTIRSTPPDPEAEEPPPGTAAEVLWRTREQVEEQYGEVVAEAAFELPLDEPSDVLVQEQEAPATATPAPTPEGEEGEGEDGSEEETAVYYIIQVSGREVRPLSESIIESRKQELVTNLVEEQRQEQIAQIETFSLWRARVPSQPILDPQFLVPPTQPATEPTSIPLATATPEAAATPSETTPEPTEDGG